MSNRFHSKYHRTNHHTLTSATNPDAGHDPIASADQPFQGDFYINGSIKNVIDISRNPNQITAAHFSGNVGIGTETPQSKLTIVCSTTANGIEISQTGSGNALIVDNTSVSNQPFSIDKYGSVGFGMPIPAQGTNSKAQINGDLSFIAPNKFIIGNGYNNLNTGGYNYFSAGSIGAIKFATIDGTKAISFYYAPAGTASTPAISLNEGMFMDSTGNVSVGYSGTLSNKLTVGGNAKVTGDLNVTGNVYYNGGIAPTTYYAYLTADDTTSIVDNINITDVQNYKILITPGTYKVDAVTYFQPTSSLGITYGFAFTNTIDWVSLSETFGQTDTFPNTAYMVNLNTLPLTNSNISVTTNDSVYTFETKGIIKVSGTGLFKINASNVSTGTQTLKILRGSMLSLTKIV
jgi:hypothetical protein